MITPLTGRAASKTAAVWPIRYDMHQQHLLTDSRSLLNFLRRLFCDCFSESVALL